MIRNAFPVKKTFLPILSNSENQITITLLPFAAAMAIQLATMTSVIVPNVTRNTTSSSTTEAIALQVHWATICFSVMFVILIMTTVIGNMLVILSLLTTKRLRSATNYFVFNLAVTDLLVGLFVMPPAVIYFVEGKFFIKNHIFFHSIENLSLKVEFVEHHSNGYIVKLIRWIWKPFGTVFNIH